MKANVGSVERVIRALLALALCVVLVQRDQWGWVETVLALSAVFLLLNALSGRCYLWHWVGLSSQRKGGDTACRLPPQKDASID